MIAISASLVMLSSKLVAVSVSMLVIVTVVAPDVPLSDVKSIVQASVEP